MFCCEIVSSIQFRPFRVDDTISVHQHLHLYGVDWRNDFVKFVDKLCKLEHLKTLELEYGGHETTSQILRACEQLTELTVLSIDGLSLEEQNRKVPAGLSPNFE